MTRQKTLFWALMVLLLAAPTSASVVLELTLEQMVQQASAIFHGRVVAQRAERVGRVIVTWVEVEVIECVKGNHEPGEIVTVQRLGGVVGDFGMRVPGEASFTTGQEVYLFLESNPMGGAQLVLGMSQGKFDVLADTESGRTMLTRSLDGMKLVTLDAELSLRFGGGEQVDLDIELTADPDSPLERSLLTEQSPLWISMEDLNHEVLRLLSLREDQ